MGSSDENIPVLEYITPADPDLIGETLQMDAGVPLTMKYHAYVPGVDDAAVTIKISTSESGQILSDDGVGYVNGTFDGAWLS